MPSAKEQELSGARGRSRRPGVPELSANTGHLLAAWVPVGEKMMSVFS